MKSNKMYFINSIGLLLATPISSYISVLVYAVRVCVGVLRKIEAKMEQLDRMNV